MNLNRIVGWFLVIALAPYILQQAIILARDPWAIEQTYVFFMPGPAFHNVTLLILSLVALVLWFTSKFENTIQRVEGVALRIFCSVCFYELIWHMANGIKIGSNYVFTWQWWITASDLIGAFPILTVIAVVLIVVHNKMNKTRYTNVTAFLVFLTVFIVAFLIQGMIGLDWSPLAIRYNVPLLWLITKVFGYFMWVFI